MRFKSLWGTTCDWLMFELQQLPGKFKVKQTKSESESTQKFQFNYGDIFASTSDLSAVSISILT